VPSPDHRTADNVLSGVSCISASACIAVGSYENGNIGNAGNIPHTLIESYG
jgi:hypothetical protein